MNKTKMLKARIRVVVDAFNDKEIDHDIYSLRLTKLAEEYNRPETYIQQIADNQHKDLLLSCKR